MLRNAADCVVVHCIASSIPFDTFPARHRTARIIGWVRFDNEATHLVIRIVERIYAILKPVLQRQADFTEIFLLEHVLVPYDELDHAELIGERQIDRKVEGRTLRRVYGVRCAFQDGRLLSVAQDRYDDEAVTRRS